MEDNYKIQKMNSALKYLKAEESKRIETSFKNLLKDFEGVKNLYNFLNIQKVDVDKDKSWNEFLTFNNTPFPSSKIFSIVLILLFIVGFDISLFGKLVSLFAVSPFNFPTSKLLLVITFPSIIMFALLVMVILITIQNNKKKEVKLEDWDFDKRFDVLSENQVEARYLITPSFMERLKNLETAFGIENLKCSFIKDKVIFAISTKKDLFEFGSLYHSLSKSKAVEEVYNQIKSVQNMISYFKFNEKIGL